MITQQKAFFLQSLIQVKLFWVMLLNLCFQEQISREYWPNGQCKSETKKDGEKTHYFEFREWGELRYVSIFNKAHDGVKIWPLKKDRGFYSQEVYESGKLTKEEFYLNEKIRIRYSFLKDGKMDEFFCWDENGQLSRHKKY